MTLNLTPDLELRLRREAERQGLEADVYAAQLIETLLPSPPKDSESLWNTLTPEEWIKEFDAYLASRDPNQPPLPEEAYERASFYKEEW